jgi:hypothetical protein
MADVTLSEHLMQKAAYTDMADYQQLKVAKDMEIEATRKLYEHLKRLHGEAGAKAIMKARGYKFV